MFSPRLFQTSLGPAQAGGQLPLSDTFLHSRQYICNCVQVKEAAGTYEVIPKTHKVDVAKPFTPQTPCTFSAPSGTTPRKAITQKHYVQTSVFFHIYSPQNNTLQLHVVTSPAHPISRDSLAVK